MEGEQSRVQESRRKVLFPAFSLNSIEFAESRFVPSVPSPGSWLLHRCTR